MHIWGVSGSGVDHANLNATTAGGFDAIVDANAGAAVGPVYATVTAALAASKKSIFVRSGAYASGFAITSGMTGIRIVGERRPTPSGSTITDGPRFGGAITVAGSRHVIANIGVQGVGSTGFDLNAAPYCKLVGCVATGCVGTGIVFTGQQWGALVLDCEIINCGNGIIVQSSAASDVLTGVELIANRITSVSGYGILIGGTSVAQTSNYRSVGVRGNTVRSCSVLWGDGIGVLAGYGAIISGNHVLQSGHATTNPDANGIRVEVPGATYNNRVTVEGNHVIGNLGYGISLSAVSSRVAVGLNAVRLNGAGGFQNCASAPGYDNAATYGSNVGN